MIDTTTTTATPEIPGAPRVLTEAPAIHQELRLLYDSIEAAFAGIEASLDDPQWATMVEAFSGATPAQRRTQGANAAAAVAALRDTLMQARKAVFVALYMTATLSYHNGGSAVLIEERTKDPATVARTAAKSLLDPLFALGVLAAFEGPPDTHELAMVLAAFPDAGTTTH